MSGFANYDDVLMQLKAYGLVIDGIDVDSARPRRCRVEGDKSREKRGWYWLSSFQVDGDLLIIGAYGIYSGNDSGKQTIKLPKDKKDRLTPEQIEAQKIRQREAQKKADAERQREADKAAAHAAVVWKKCSAEGQSEYLTRKQIGAHGVRFSDTGSVVVPMMDAQDKLRGLQFILPKDHERRKKTGRDKEFWPAGLTMQGTFYLVGGIPRDILLVAEGYATAASLHEATGLPCAVVWSANNIMPACLAMKKKYKRIKQLICADDDWLQKCAGCGKYTPVADAKCAHCGADHGKQNAGISNAEAAAIAVSGAWIAPVFSQPRTTDKKGPTDFNDLHVLESLATVHGQIAAKLEALAWQEKEPRAGLLTQGGGERGALKSMLSIDEAVERFALVFGGKGTMFDYQEHALVPKADVLDILPEHGWRDMRAIKKVARLDEVGFDPACTDPRITCNLWGGWPTMPKQGRCDMLLELLEYLCSNEENYKEIFSWLLKWLAYPIQNPGAKMKTALVFHGPQGTGKNLFFEAYMAIFGEYGRIVDQHAIEDKFNDWASRKLFLIADEVVAQQELFHVKNKLKAFITGEWIRINPKNVAAHDERNHVNLVFLSNESRPLVLEKDDRRYTVIHTPEKLDAEFYRKVRDELQNGGIAALHHYLLNLDLGEFDEHSKPPMTKAKAKLIESGLDSVTRFLQEWQRNEIEGIPFCPCQGSHLYGAYKKWCEQNGERSPRPLAQFIGTITHQNGWKGGDPINTFETLTSTTRKSRKMVIPPDYLLAESARIDASFVKSEEKTQIMWLTECFFAFANAAGYAE
jgi:putative DNA primase/helicase